MKTIAYCVLSDVMRLHTIAPNCTTINMYGSTETQRSVGYFRVTNETLRHCKEVVCAGVLSISSYYLFVLLIILR